MTETIAVAHGPWGPRVHKPLRVDLEQVKKAAQASPWRHPAEAGLIEDLSFHQINLAEIETRLKASPSPSSYSSAMRHGDELDLDRRNKAVLHILRELQLHPIDDLAG